MPSYYSNEFVNEQYRLYMGENRQAVRLKKILNKPINAAKKIKTRKKSCPQCSASAAGRATVCKSCGYEFKATARYVINKIKHILRIDRAFALSNQKTLDPEESFFSSSEIEELLKMHYIKNLVFMNLDNMDLLDEMSLIELGGMLNQMDYHHDIIK